jgi:hypothetical protein
MMAEAANHVEHQIHRGLGGSTAQKSEFGHGMDDPIVTRFGVVRAHGRRSAALADQIVGKNFVKGLADGCKGLATAKLLGGEDTVLLSVEHGTTTQEFEQVIKIRFVQEDGATGRDIVNAGFLQQHDVESDAPPREGVAGPDDDVQDRNFEVNEVRRFSVEKGFEHDE